MNNDRVLKRQWQEHTMWISGIALILFFLVHDFFQGASAFRLLRVSLFIPFFVWGAFLSLRNPDVLIRDDKIYLFGRLKPKPLEVSLSEIQSIERHSETPIWRVPPLRFYLKNGSNLAFSTGGNESRMKRIMKFIETETALQIQRTWNRP